MPAAPTDIVDTMRRLGLEAYIARPGVMVPIARLRPAQRAEAFRLMDRYEGRTLEELLTVTIPAAVDAPDIPCINDYMYLLMVDNDTIVVTLAPPGCTCPIARSPDCRGASCWHMDLVRIVMAT